MSVDARDVAGARKMLATARRSGMKYNIELPEATEEAQVVRDAGLDPVDALMIGDVYCGKAIDRHLFHFSAGRHEIIVEQPVYDKGFAYTPGRSVDPATAKEVPRGYELELARRDWLR
jgi:hypothetical protein